MSMWIWHDSFWFDRPAPNRHEYKQGWSWRVYIQGHTTAGIRVEKSMLSEKNNAHVAAKFFWGYGNHAKTQLNKLLFF